MRIKISGRQQDGTSKISDFTVYAILILIVSFIVLVMTFNPNLGYLSDCARHYLVGQSLAGGAGFVQIWDAEHPPDGLSSPLYPLVIAITSLTISESILTMKALTGLFFIGSIWIYFLLFKKIGLAKEVILVTLLPLLFNYWVLKHASLMLTEIPFMFLSGGGLLFYIKSKDEDALDDLNWWLALLFIALAYYMRSIGIVLAASLVLNELRKLRWKRLSIATISFIALFLPWMLRGMSLDVLTHFDIITALNPLEPFGERANFIDIIQRIDINLINYLSSYLSSAVIPVSRWFADPSNIFSWLLGSLLVGLIIYGLLKVGKHRFIISSYLLSYITVLFLFPQAYSGIRFLVPLLPLLYLLLYVGLRSLADKIKIKSFIAVGVMITITALNLWSLKSLNSEQSKPLLPQWKGYFEVAKWAGDNLGSDAVIATRIGQEFYLYSARKTVNFPFFERTDDILGYLRFRNVTHIVSDDLDYPITDMKKSTVPTLQKIRSLQLDMLGELYRSKTGETKLFELNYLSPIIGIEGDNEREENKDFNYQDN